ncbi:Putative signal recognition particle, SRP54 subunit, GTPase domain, AAA+ ATPase [Septoria linicola]|uniref:Signal recognition particle receptor subunit alpha homolog n=1 Tax=Septoria linicola TaxID=215465 RepID=A0A9Q9EGS6_9PEZI|nr:Putative signal recognition particle, SRP54 subunit, GTPase domain, AAA+ ATPase [Septoria linicola]
MLDAFEIVTTSGIVLWRKQYSPVSQNVINSLINDVFIEQRQKPGAHETVTNAPYRKDKYTLKYTTVKDVGLIFVAVYQSLLSLQWVDNLLTTVKALFTRQYGTELKKQHVTKIDTQDFDPTFDALVRKLDTGSTRRRPSEVDSESQVEFTPPSSSASQAGDDDAPPAPPIPHFKKSQVLDDTTSADIPPIATPDTSRPNTPLHAPSHLLAAKAGPGGLSRKQRKKANQFGTSAPASSGDESDRRPKSSQGKAKAKRRWDASGVAQEDDDEVLDYSAAATPSTEEPNSLDVDEVNSSQMGSRTLKGQFVLKDLDDEVDAILAESKQQKVAASTEKEVSGLIGTASSKLSGLFRNVVGGKALSKQDLQQPMQQVRNLLLEKNIAPEAADRLCSSVEADLLNQKTASFTSIDKTIRESMSKALTRILTPTSSLDLLRNINNTIEGRNPRPYVISIVGVNGVGKSTNLSKIAYFLLQNKFRVLVVACDTFRSGAVEQLRVHVRNLTELSRRENVGQVELFEKGYGKDAADVAKQAVTFAANAGGGGILYDVVLIDTAGRRHNDQRLMSSLTKFGQLANPDKIFMVGEALVGTDSVSQARHFAEQFVDTKGVMRNGGVGMDGFIISKCDTVGDMVGTLVSMVHATGIPVVFLGVGQHYGDLRGLNVDWAVNKLMK